MPVAKPIVAAPPVAETFEVLAYRMPTAAEPIAVTTIPSTTVFIAPAEPTPPPPKHLSRRRERFTWESPEMYREE